MYSSVYGGGILFKLKWFSNNRQNYKLYYETDRLGIRLRLLNVD